MPFSIDWFLTIPGILISVGVLLLIVALVLFVLSTIKDKKEMVPSVLEGKKEDPVAVVAQEPVPVAMEASTPVTTVEEVNNSVEIPNVIEEKKEEPVPVAMEASTPVTVVEDVPLIDTVSDNIVIPSFEGDEITPIDEVIPVDDATEFVVEDETIPQNNNESVQIPVVENSQPEPAVENVQEEIKTEEINNEVQFEIPEPINTESHSIYGGADPLEATQNLPKIDVHHEPYSGGTVETTIVDDATNNSEVVEQVTEKPIFEVNNESVQIPVIENSEPEPIPDVQNTESTPEVVAIPEDEIESL